MGTTSVTIFINMVVESSPMQITDANTYLVESDAPISEYGVNG